MDAAGAKALRRRMDEQEQWRQAEAVRDGRQPSIDPDGDALVEFGDGFRLYSFRAAGERRVRKSLVNGIWQTDGAVELLEAGPSEGRGPDSPEGACLEPELNEGATDREFSIQDPAPLRRS